MRSAFAEVCVVHCAKGADGRSGRQSKSSEQRV